MIDLVKTVGGVVLVRIKKSDGGWHRTTFVAGADVDRQMTAINADLQRMGVGQESDYARVKTAVQAI
jgi:hypothetical protein